ASFERISPVTAVIHIRDKVKITLRSSPSRPAINAGSESPIARRTSTKARGRAAREPPGRGSAHASRRAYRRECARLRRLAPYRSTLSLEQEVAAERDDRRLDQPHENVDRDAVEHQLPDVRAYDHHGAEQNAG